MTNNPQILGGLTTEEFFNDYWQQQPLVIRNALFNLPELSADELAGLALETEIESRLIIEHPATATWELFHGPLTVQQLQTVPSSHWTLLVQAVDHWEPAVHALLDHFDFLPRWRLDDIMVSFAADQGGVGPHYDNYDVFLLQTLGRRRWRIGQHCDDSTELVTDAPLRLLKDFEQHVEYLLEPGDILYLPPRVAHWGIAEGDCMTYSIGFRAPTAIELLDDLATELLADPELKTAPFTDPPLDTRPANGAIAPAYIDAVKNMLIAQLSDNTLLANWFARFMTARKYPELELPGFDSKDSDTTTQNTPAQDWRAALTRGQLLGWHPASRCAVLNPQATPAPGGSATLLGAPMTTVLAVDGELYQASPRLAGLMSKQRQFSARDLIDLTASETALLEQLLTQGSLEMVDRNR